MSGVQFSGLMAYIDTAALPPHRLAHRGWRLRTQHIGSPAYQALAAAAAVQPAAVLSEAASDSLQTANGAGLAEQEPIRELSPPNAYHFFDRPAGKLGMQATFLPEYAAALAACAACAWVMPPALHKVSSGCINMSLTLLSAAMGVHVCVCACVCVCVCVMLATGG